MADMDFDRVQAREMKPAFVPSVGEILDYSNLF